MIRLFFYFRWLAVFIVAGFLLWQVFVFLRPVPPSLGEAEVRAVRAAAAAFAGDMETAAPAGTARVGLVPLVGDRSGQATHELADRLRQSRRWALDERSVPQAFFQDVYRALADASNIEQVLGAGRQVDLDIIVAGRLVETHTRADGGAHAVLDLYAYDLAAGDWIVRRNYVLQWDPGWLDRTGLYVETAPWWQKILLWALVVAALPWLTPFLARWARARRSNAASTAVLALYLAAALLLAGALNGFRLAGLGDWLVLMAALVLGGAYTFWACERIAAEA